MLTICKTCRREFSYKRANRRPIYCSCSCRAKDPEMKALLSVKAKERIAADGGTQARNARGDMAYLRNPAVRQKISKTLQAIGHRPSVRGGKGHGLTNPQAMLLTRLGELFSAELVVLTGWKRPLPTWYQIDIANEDAMIAIEVDGSSHRSRVAQDQRRDAFLAESGWTVLRFTNQEVLNSIESVAAKILSLCTTSPSTCTRHSECTA